MLKSFWVLCGGGYGGVIAAREIPVAVREVDHVGTEVGLITCVLSRISQAARHPAPVSRGTRGLFCSSPTRSMTLKVVTENR